MSQIRIEQIANHYGTEHQLLKSLEELDECREAIVDILPICSPFPLDRMAMNRARKDLASEIADVQIMLAQVAYLLGIKSFDEAETNEKLNRQIKRIQAEKEMCHGKK